MNVSRYRYWRNVRAEFLFGLVIGVDAANRQTQTSSSQTRSIVSSSQSSLSLLVQFKVLVWFKSSLKLDWDLSLELDSMYVCELNSSATSGDSAIQVRPLKLAALHFYIIIKDRWVILTDTVTELMRKWTLILIPILWDSNGVIECVSWSCH